LLHKAVQEGEADVYLQVLTGGIWRQSCLPCLHSSTAAKHIHTLQHYCTAQTQAVDVKAEYTVKLADIQNGIGTFAETYKKAVTPGYRPAGVYSSTSYAAHLSRAWTSNACCCKSRLRELAASCSSW